MEKMIKEYSKVDLKSNVFKDIMIKLYNGKRFNRDEVIDSVEKYYRENGGEKIDRGGKELFTDAIESLQKDKEHEINNVVRGSGTWELNYKGDNKKDDIEVNNGNIIDKSIDVLTELLNSEDERIRLDSAIALLEYYK